MIINYNKFADNFSNFKNYFFFLIYGPNYGKSEQLVGRLKKFLQHEENIDSSITVSDESLVKNKNYLNEKFYSEDLFAQKKIIYCSLQNPDILPKLLDFKKIRNKNKTIVIIKASELDKKSKIRKLFESDDKFCTIPCYEDTELEKKSVIQYYLDIEKIRLKDEILNFIVKIPMVDRNSLIQETEKIILFYKKENNISIEQIKEIINYQTSKKIDDLIYIILSGKLTFTERIHDNLLKNGVSNIQILNSMSRHFFKLLLYKEKLKIESGSENAIKHIKPPIFFKNKEKFINQAKIWSKIRICNVIERIHLLEKRIKTEPQNVDLQIKFMMFSIAKTSKALFEIT
ncbi:MAG: DNA polymerase III subunit delta [Rickettsiales bacterium]|nr:DNA polymerase III subunit delta [Rickettsiales bacterium]OUV54801.1 MAG: DNA polymerase III subunit delta [Rickettsiales bacterium TMED127]